MGKKLKLLARKSNLMDISIKYGKERIRFNLFEELQIDDTNVNNELKNQPTHYGFLSLLMVKMKREMDEKKSDLDKCYKSLFISYKEVTDRYTGKPNSNDVAEALAVQDGSYQIALFAYQQAEDNYGVIKACVEAFTQRSHLVQSLSANIRKNNES